MVLAGHFLPSLDWLVTLAIGLIIAAAGMLLFRQARSGGLAFALALFTAETGTLVTIRALIAAGTSSRWQYIMPFALVLVPALYVTFILTRLRRWRAAGFNQPGAWRALHLIIPLIAIHAAYDLMLILAFGHAFPVAPTLGGFIVDTTVNLGLALFGLVLVRSRRQALTEEQQAA